jgi:enamine deaminase RidA (YjgF/YER057c/UK114 family)
VPECYKELQNVLGKLGLSANNIIKENVYALDIEKFKEQIAERKKFYGNTDYPAATWVQIDRLYSVEHLVEIELIAVK